jgi:acyl-CoA synthetase (AMP-forming)/AMP-acid ligase II
VALLYEGEANTYGEVDAKARAIACQRYAGGLHPGQRLAILAERRPELIWTLLGVLRLGLSAGAPAGPARRRAARCRDRGRVGRSAGVSGGARPGDRDCCPGPRV